MVQQSISGALMGQYGRVTTSQPTDEHKARDLKVGTVVPVWVLTVIAAVVIGIVSARDQYITWLSITLAAAVLLTFAVQLSTLTKQGFVDRVMASLGGAVLILAIATGVLAALTAMKG